MENFYIIPEGTRLHKDYWEHKESKKKCREIFIEFAEKHGIESYRYVSQQDRIGLVPLKSDLEKFKKVLNKPDDSGVCFFRRNSSINKEWVTMLNDNNVRVIHGPWITIYFNVHGKLSYRLFDVNGTVYCSIAANMENITSSEEYQEIKASEFFKILEDEG